MKFDCPSSFDERRLSEHTVAARQRDAAAADQRHGLADPVARVGAGELRVLEDRVEAGRLVVERIVVAAGVERRDAQPHPVEVDRQLGGGEQRADVDLLLGRTRRGVSSPIA